MSSLHQDHLLAEGSDPVPGPASTARTARPAARRAAGAATGEASPVPTQRQARTRSRARATTAASGRPAASRKAGTPARTARSTAVKAAAVAVTGARSAGAKAATTKAATVKAAAAAKAAASTTVATRRAARTAAKAAPATTAPATTAAAKAVVAKPVSVQAAPAKTVPAKTAPAKTAPAKTAPAKTAAAKADPAKPAATKAPSAKAVGPTAAPRKAAVGKAAPVRRPRPYPRDAVEAAGNPQPDVEVVPSASQAGTPGPVADAESVVAAFAVRGYASVRRILRRRPTLYFAAALVAATSFGTVTAGGPHAVAATTAGHSVNIAHELGIDRQSVRVTSADARNLQLLAASRNQRGVEEVAAAQAQAAANERAIEAVRPKAVLPVKGARLTSVFGMRWGVLHAGIDLAAPLGTPEYAAMDGVVLRAGPASGFGLAVYIQHSNGDVTVYGHMEKILVTEGQVVRAGETIALLGANGQATGPHLHFEVHVGGMLGTKIDPIPWLRARGVVV